MYPQHKVFDPIEYLLGVPCDAGPREWPEPRAPHGIFSYTEPCSPTGLFPSLTTLFYTLSKPLLVQFWLSWGEEASRHGSGRALRFKNESPQEAVSRCRQVWRRKSDAHFLEASPAPTQHECINNSPTFRIASRQSDRPLQGDWFCHNHVGRQAHVPFTVWEPRRERMPGSTCWLRKVGLHGSVSS